MPHRVRFSVLLALLIAILAPGTVAPQAEMLAARQESDTAVPPTLPTLQFTGKVVGVTDGDTISVMHNGRAEKIRLHGIDCPEKGQAYGNGPSKPRQSSSSTRT